MADSKISALTDGSPSASGDALVIARSGASDKIVLASPIPQKIYDYTVAGSDKASIDTNVDGTTVANFAGYDLLEVWVLARTDEATAFSVVNMTLNNDGTANYDQEGVQGVNVTPSTATGSAGSAWAFVATGTTEAANVFAAIHISIPFYAVTTAQKVGLLLGGHVDTTLANSVGRIQACNWRSTAAITRVAIAPATAGKKLKIGSRLVVYGR